MTEERPIRTYVLSLTSQERIRVKADEIKEQGGRGISLWKKITLHRKGEK